MKVFLFILFNSLLSSVYAQSKPGYHSIGGIPSLGATSYPSVTYSVSGPSGFWIAPLGAKVGSKVNVGSLRPFGNLWNMEYVDITSADVKYAIRLNTKQRLYLTYASDDSVKLGPSGASGRYFQFDLGENGGYIFRVPGKSKSLGISNGMLHVVSGVYEWSVNLSPYAVRFKRSSSSRWADLLLIRDRQTMRKWRCNICQEQGPVDVDYDFGGNDKWLSSFDYSARNFKPFSKQNLYLTSVSNQYKLRSTGSSNNRLFEIEYSFSGTKIVRGNNFISQNIPGSSGLLVPASELFATDWSLTHLGFCCDGECIP